MYHLGRWMTRYDFSYFDILWSVPGPFIGFDHRLLIDLILIQYNTNTSWNSLSNTLREKAMSSGKLPPSDDSASLKQNESYSGNTTWLNSFFLAPSACVTKHGWCRLATECYSALQPDSWSTINLFLVFKNGLALKNLKPLGLVSSFGAASVPISSNSFWR